MRIYLDNAATSYPKPEAVYAAVDRYNRHIGMAIGRGASRDAVDASRIVERCRQRVARLFGVSSVEHVVFTFNGTDSLNMALHGVCRPGDHVIATTLEHNSVLRPLRWLQQQRQIDVTWIEPDSTGAITPIQVRSALRPSTRLLAVQHASNVTGRVQSVDDLCAVARAAGVLTLVDAAQSAGHIPIDLARQPIDLLACPGHKGLLGPLGTGVLVVRPGLESELACWRLGGTGTYSDDETQPMTMPDRFEAGNHNAPGLAGLSEGVAALASPEVTTWQADESERIRGLVDRLRAVNGVTVYGHEAGQTSTGVVSFTLQGYEPQEVASILDESFGIQVRAGLHCAPGTHRFLGTLAQGGTVRLSPGPWSRAEDLQAVIDAVRDLAGA